MTKDELWAIITDRNPRLTGDRPVTLSPRGLKKLFDTGWERGYKQGMTTGMAIAGRDAHRDDPLSALFGGIFL